MKNKQLIRLLKITGSFVFISGLVYYYAYEFYARISNYIVYITLVSVYTWYNLTYNCEIELNCVALMCYFSISITICIQLAFAVIRKHFNVTLFLDWCSSEVTLYRYKTYMHKLNVNYGFYTYTYTHAVMKNIQKVVSKNCTSWG